MLKNNKKEMKVALKLMSDIKILHYQKLEDFYNHFLFYMLQN
jgi:hypothetical protein